MPEQQYRLTNLGHAILDVQEAFKLLDPDQTEAVLAVLVSKQREALQDGKRSITLDTVALIADAAKLKLVISFVPKRPTKRGRNKA